MFAPTRGVAVRDLVTAIYSRLGKCTRSRGDRERAEVIARAGPGADACAHHGAQVPLRE